MHFISKVFLSLKISNQNIKNHFRHVFSDTVFWPCLIIQFIIYYFLQLN